MKKFKHIGTSDIDCNFFDAIGDEWMLITAKDKNTGKYNTMTASWGGIGVIWKKRVFCCVIRPQRYTYEFAENSDIITLSFFGEGYRSALNFCGTKSGRDYDKAKETGLTPRDDIEDGVYFDEAKLVLVGRKLYAGDLDEDCFIDKSIIPACYPGKDYHRAYICEITDVLMAE